MGFFPFSSCPVSVKSCTKEHIYIKYDSLFLIRNVGKNSREHVFWWHSFHKLYSAAAKNNFKNHSGWWQSLLSERAAWQSYFFGLQIPSQDNSGTVVQESNFAKLSKIVLIVYHILRTWNVLSQELSFSALHCFTLGTMTPIRRDFMLATYS